VQAQPDAWMLEENLRKGQVRLPISFFNNVVEVSHRLMGMDYDSKEDFIQGQDSFLLRPNLPTCRPALCRFVSAKPTRHCQREFTPAPAGAKARSTSQISALRERTMASTLIRIR
jgi:hypothetical protein